MLLWALRKNLFSIQNILVLSHSLDLDDNADDGDLIGLFPVTKLEKAPKELGLDWDFSIIFFITFHCMLVPKNLHLKALF